jgi:hypothetical protein
MDMAKERTAAKISTLRGLGMMVIRPSQSTLLPPHYKQANLLRDGKYK